MIKIFAYPSHCDGKHMPGVDYVRVVRPMEELNKQPGFKVRIWDGKPTKKEVTNEAIAKANDILYINYMTNAPAFVSMAFWFKKFGKKVVVDIDDFIWEIQEDNAAYSTYAPGSEGRATITDIIARACDYTTCTNSYLRNGIVDRCGVTHDKVKILPNYIDLDTYTWKKKPVDNSTITIGYFGSSSHFNDLVTPGFVGGMTRIMSEDPRVRFFTIGAMIQELKKKFGARYTTGFGDHDIYKWVKMMPEMLKDLDIMVAPLKDCTYARAKSGIKYLEYSSAKLPGCYQNIRQYRELIENRVNGYLCETTSDWYENLKELVNSVEKRREIGENAYQNVKTNHTFGGNVDKIAEIFTKIAEM